MKMERSEELAMFRTALDVADLHPKAVALPQDQNVIVGAMRFHYLDWGGSGVPILFLHGGGINAHTWDCAAVMLRERYRCIALDQRGHGDSEWSPVVDYRTAAHVGDIEGIDRRDETGTSDRGWAIDGRYQCDRLCDAP